MRGLSASRLLLAFCFVGFGVLLLLVNTGIISVEIMQAINYCYPFLFLLVGIWLLVEKLVTRGRRGSGFGGLFLTIFGGLLAADRLGYIHFTFWDIWNLWPFLLVYSGFKILFGGAFHIRVDTGKKSPKRTPGWRMVSDATFADPNWLVEPMDRSLGVADYTFDFTKAFIPDKETRIKLSGWVGDINIKIPEDVEFMVDAHASVGDLQIGDMTEDGLLKDFFFTTNGYDEAARKLIFDFRFKVLDLRIDRV